MTDASNMRDYLNLFEAAASDYVGKVQHPEVSYHAEETKGMISKIIVNLKGSYSGRFTKIGRNLKRIEWLESKIKQLKEETKAEVKEFSADWFHASDAASTRVIETVSFIFQLSKDPKPTETVKYAKVIEELQDQLTPELQKVLEALISKHSSSVQKSPSLKTIDKATQTEESINEGIGEKLKGFYSKLKNWVDSWGSKYDSKLNALKAQVGLTEENLAEFRDSETSFEHGDMVSITNDDGSVEYGHVEDCFNGRAKVELYGRDGFGSFRIDQLTPATPEEVKSAMGLR